MSEIVELIIDRENMVTKSNLLIEAAYNTIFVAFKDDHYPYPYDNRINHNTSCIF